MARLTPSLRTSHQGATHRSTSLLTTGAVIATLVSASCDPVRAPAQDESARVLQDFDSSRFDDLEPCSVANDRGGSYTLRRDRPLTHAGCASPAYRLENDLGQQIFSVCRAESGTWMAHHYLALDKRGNLLGHWPPLGHGTLERALEIPDESPICSLIFTVWKHRLFERQPPFATSCGDTTYETEIIWWQPRAEFAALKAHPSSGQRGEPKVGALRVFRRQGTQRVELGHLATHWLTDDDGTLLKRSIRPLEATEDGLFTELTEKQQPPAGGPYHGQKRDAYFCAAIKHIGRSHR